MNLPVIMIGTQRSGSNLLRLILNQIPTLVAPHPPHILQRFSPLLSCYKDLKETICFELLIEHVSQLVELNPVPWTGVDLNRKDIFNRCQERSLIAIFKSIYDIYAESKGVKNWCCKSLANINYMPGINAYFNSYFQGIKYLWIYRDGRDVATSFTKAIVGEKHFYHLAREWSQTQILALEMRKNLGENQLFSLSYEALTQNTESVLKSLCDFLEVPYTSSMLDFHQSQEAYSTAAASNLWSEVINPIKSNNTKKFLNYSNQEELRIFELIAGDVLEILGYERKFTKVGETYNFTAEEIEQFNLVNQQRKQQIKETIEPGDRERREKQENLLKSIASQYFSVKDS